jgi:hypothetical protein
MPTQPLQRASNRIIRCLEIRECCRLIKVVAGQGRSRRVNVSMSPQAIVRKAKAARKLMRKLLKKQSFAPSRVVTDKLQSFPSTFRALGRTVEHVHSQRANNRAENSHQPVRRWERRCLTTVENLPFSD